MNKQTQINTSYQWHGDDIRDFLRGVIRSQLGDYFSGDHQYLLKNRLNDVFILVTPPISTMESDQAFDYYLDKAKQPGNNRRDVFDELMPKLTSKDDAQAKILFSFNLHNYHWTTCELQIQKTENNYDVTIFSHDPYGGGVIPEDVFCTLSSAVERRIKACAIGSKVGSFSKESPYSARQHCADGSSCGLISVDDTIKLIKGKEVNRPSIYPVGASELRQAYLTQLSTLGLTAAIENRLRKANTASLSDGNAKSSKQTSAKLVFINVSEDDSSSYTSSDDASSNEFSYSEQYFSSLPSGYPFKIQMDKPGSISSETSGESSSSHSEHDIEPMAVGDEDKVAYVLNIPVVANGAKNTLITKIKKILLPQAFRETDEQSLSEAKARLKINVGFNRMKSISKKKNRILQKSLSSAEDQIEEEPIKTFSFFWEPKWFDNIQKKPVSLKFVRAWYKKLKAKDSNKAKNAVRLLEEKTTADMVPYQQIRERLKNHKHTKKFVKHFQRDDNVSHIYLASFDDDFVCLRYAKTGLFSEYDRLIAEHEAKYANPPQVLTTGYLVSSLHMPIIEVAVKLDMAVRQATSQIFKNAVYYCEPNTIIYVQPGSDTVEASFISSGPSCKNEMPTLMADLIKKRSLDANKCFVFYSSNAPLVTNMPVRMQHTKKSTRKIFVGQKTKDGKVLRFNFQDLKQLINTSQSHVQARDWANKIVNCLPIPASCDYGSYKLARRDIEHILKSLIPRVFTYYNPVYTANDRLNNGDVVPEKVNNYIHHLEYVCDHYKKTLVFKQSTKDRGYLKNKELLPLRQEIDAISTIEAAMKCIGRLVNDVPVANAINDAAKSSGQAIKQVLRDTLSFDYPRMIYSMLVDLYNDLELDMLGCCDYDDLGNDMHAVLESLTDNSFIHNFNQHTIDELKEKNFIFGTNLLHLAVLSGNKAAVKWLIAKGMLINQSAEDDDEVLPIHLAIIYCANHGNDLELIKLCLSKESITSKLGNKFSPLMMAITMLDEPSPVVSELCQNGALPAKLHQDLDSLLGQVERRELRTPLLACIHYLPFNTALAIALIEQGGDVNQQGIIESKAYSKESEKQFTLPLLECITNDAIEILKYLLENGAQTSEIYDSEGRPPLIIAIHEVPSPIVFVELLLERGADLEEHDLYEFTYPIHEAISPLRSRYLAPGPNREKYEEAFMSVVRNMGCSSAADQSLFKCVLSHSTNRQLELEDGAGNTPLEVALEIKDNDMICLLLDREVNTDKLDREQIKYIRDNTSYEIYHDEEEEEKADHENMDLAEHALAAEGVDLNFRDQSGFVEAYSALCFYKVDNPIETLERLAELSDNQDAEEESSETSSSHSYIYARLHDEPDDFLYDDEEDMEVEGQDYPDAPNSPTRHKASYGSGYIDSYEMEERSSFGYSS